MVRGLPFGTASGERSTNHPASPDIESGSGSHVSSDGRTTCGRASCDRTSCDCSTGHLATRHVSAGHLATDEWRQCVLKWGAAAKR
jgi:hypothetical protein